MLTKYFNGKKPSDDISPDEGVAYGAAIQAYTLGSAPKSDKFVAPTLLDIAPLSLGIETSGEMMTKIIERNSSIPCTQKQIFTTYADGQTAVDIRIFEGERVKTKDNNLLGNFKLKGIKPAPRGTPQIEVVFKLDCNGILAVSASDKDSGAKNAITVTNDGKRLSPKEIQDMVSAAERFKEEDKKAKEHHMAKSQLEYVVSEMKDEKAKKSAMEWMDKNLQTASIDELMQKCQEFSTPEKPQSDKPTSTAKVEEVD